MSKIRINELARELEVKTHVILDVLPELGISEKKTHSSSIDQDEADRVRIRLKGAAPEREPSELPARESEVSVEPAPEVQAEPERPAAQPIPQALHVTPVVVERFEAKPVTLPAPPEAPAPETAIKAPEPAARRAPLRPPLAGMKPAAPAPPPQAAPPTVTPPQPPAAPVTPSPAAPGPVAQAPVTQAPPAPPPPRSVAMPARPVPPPRPGQILSGPRQPLPPIQPGAEASPQPGQPPLRPQPSIPKPLARRPERPHPAAAAPTPQKPKPPLAGQPAARPVVPPRPDLVARLAQQTKMPGQPQPRPGIFRSQPTPIPGQPIYRGPIRPGQPLVRVPGPAPGRRREPGMPVPEIEPAPSPATPQRRHQAKPTRAATGRERERDREGALRGPVHRRSEPEEIRASNRDITISEGITVKELSEKLGLKAGIVIKKLVERKIFATINQALDAKLAEDIARAFGASANKVSYEEESVQDIELAEEERDLVKRPPVITVMGHVDHGKTSLLDAIRATSVAEHEAGGITQHIGAYYVEKNGNRLVFIDTPGHEAFTRMRARGAKVTDIVVLVVAADDGVMPQTLEAMDHARAAEVPIIVAVNKTDRPDANPERVKQQLADRGLQAEDWGGDTVMVPVSAKTRTNIDLLLEMVVLVADMQDLKANPKRPAVGSVLEAQLDRGRGPVATVLVRNGTLHVSDHFICGAVFGRVRAMFDDRGNPVEEAWPSMPVEVLGLDTLPEVGDTLQVVTDTAKAKQIVIYREAKAREQAMAKGGRMTLDKLHEQLREGETKELNIIVKTDVGGTAEVVSDTLQKLSNDKVKVRVIHTGVGAITESDVLLASASEAIVVGFNVRPERSASQLAEQEKVEIRLHTIIYELTDEIKAAMTGMLEPVFREVYRGRAEVAQTFRISKVGSIAGCVVQDGVIPRDSRIRLLRDNIVVHTGKIGSLKRFKDDASEVRAGMECGIGLENYNDVKPGDVIEAFVTERVATEGFA
ncbi:MAG: translation initiation factor IF-2 [Bryobacteraceae bacterium]|nr:translation initiation factor IF-2 [Bryobacteraceae bacterium]